MIMLMLKASGSQKFSLIWESEREGGGGGKECERRRTGRCRRIRRLRTWSALPSQSTPTVGHVEQSSSYARYAPLEHRKQLPRALSGKPPPSQVKQLAEPAAAYLALGQSSHVCVVMSAERTLRFPTPHFVQKTRFGSRIEPSSQAQHVVALSTTPEMVLMPHGAHAVAPGVLENAPRPQGVHCVSFAGTAAPCRPLGQGSQISSSLL